jgi:HD-like signal output (HDOD) protein
VIELYLTVVDALTRDRLPLPTLPDVALRIGRLCEDPQLSMDRLADEIARDPASAARLMQVANSAAFTGRPFDNLPRAVARLGLGLTRTLVTRLTMEQMFRSRWPSLDARLRQSWAESLELAALASALARPQAQLRPATAMLAGLVCEVGVLPIIRLAEERPELADDPAALDDTIRQLQARVGTHLLTAWNFPPGLAVIPLASVDESREHAGPADYADVVCAARVQLRRPQQGFLSRLLRGRSPALDKLGLSPHADPRDDTAFATRFSNDSLLLAA